MFMFPKNKAQQNRMHIFLDIQRVWYFYDGQIQHGIE